MKTENETVEVRDENVKVEKKSTFWNAAKKVGKTLGLGLIGVAAGIGIDFLATGGKYTKMAGQKAKEAISKVGKKNTAPVQVQQNNNGGGQQQYQKPYNGNGQQNRPFRGEKKEYGPKYSENN